jgi:hypothetical protein
METMRTIELNCFGIVVYLHDKDPENEGRWLGGSINSKLHDAEPGENEEDEINRDKYNVAMDALESFILAAACAGIDITTHDFEYAIETSVESCANNI